MAKASEHNRWLMVTKKEREMLKVIGQNMRKIRESKGWTLEDMEEYGGWKNWQHWHKLEQGSKSMNLVTFLRACKSLDVDFTDLLSDVEL